MKCPYQSPRPPPLVRAWENLKRLGDEFERELRNSVTEVPLADRQSYQESADNQNHILRSRSGLRRLYDVDRKGVAQGGASSSGIENAAEIILKPHHRCSAAENNAAEEEQSDNEHQPTSIVYGLRGRPSRAPDAGWPSVTSRSPSRRAARGAVDTRSDGHLPCRCWCSR
jgi:hypothetical protein